MEKVLLYVLVALGSGFVFLLLLSIGLILVHQSGKQRFLTNALWHTWVNTMEKEGAEDWDRLLAKAGKPFGWGKAEWIFVQFLSGLLPLVLIILWLLFRHDGSFPFLTFCLVPGLGFMLPYFLLRAWANYREELLSVDIARFINRYLNLLENEVPPYTAMVKAARPTRHLKHYLPSLSEWNRDRYAALESFKRQLGIDDAILLVSNLRTIEQLSKEQIALTMNRLEWAVDSRRAFRHRKKIKSLGIGYSIIVYPSFYIGLIVAMFPWYKLLTEILQKYLL